MVRPGPPPLSLCFICLLCFSTNSTVLGEGPYCNTADGTGPHDMIQNGAMNPKYMWSKRGHKTYVPVVMDHSYSYKEHSIIVGGLHEIQQKTCVEFDIYDSEAEVEEKDYVYINKNTKRGCYSYIGRIGGKQEIGLPIGCISHRTAMHEMLHALGFRHEHVRYDRDEYIIVFWGNIRQGRESNFKKRSPSDLVTGPYDYDSIMHYERKAFSVNGMETIRPLKSGAKIGVRQKMSHWDAQKVNVVYKCGGSYSNSDGGGGNHLSYSPAFRSNDNDQNQTLPIAEYDDFNGDTQTREIRRPSPPHLSDEVDGFNDISAFSDHYDNDNNDNHNHHNNNNNRPDPVHRDRHRGDNSEDEEDAEGDSDSLHNSHQQGSNNNDNGGGEPYYSVDDLYDF